MVRADTHANKCDKGYSKELPVTVSVLTGFSPFTVRSHL